ncbi:MAG TPA: efflux RND transporter periplasmic adaptor subunit [Roseiarcus sp.]|jgi:RND family efflux transporter MFP subunit|nr:efflux RND transporter periplasmic adaptor subunit [Roseiarcus sp.]
MRRVTNWLLFLLAVLALALGAAAKVGYAHAPVSPTAFGAAAAVFAALLAIRALPLRVRRPVVFVVTLAALAALTGGLAYFQFVIKPTMIKGFMAAAFAPKPTAVSVEAARIEKWPPQLTAIGTLRAYQGISIAPQAAGVVTALHFESGADVKAGDLLINIDDSVEQADLANGLAQLKNADATLARQKMLVAGGNTPQSSVDSALASRDSAAATVARTRAVIAQKAIRAPFSGRLGLRNIDLGQYASVGMALATLQQLDPIYADFPVPEEALATLAVGQDVSMTVDAIPGRTFEGKIKAIDARVSAESRNVTARAEFANADRKLLPGMFANLTVTTGASADLLTLPRTAIVYSLYGDNVFVVKPAPPPPPAHSDDGAAAATPSPPAKGLVVERRFVKVGATRGERIVVEEGVKAGEQVVTAGQIKLQAGAPVAIDQAAALPPPAVTPKP